MGLRCWEGKCLKCNCWLLIRLPGESLAMDLHCVRQNGFWRGVEQLLQTGGVHETSVRTETLLGIEEFIGVWVVAVWSEGHRNTEGLSSSTSQPACHITTLALVSPGLSLRVNWALLDRARPAPPLPGLLHHRQLIKSNPQKLVKGEHPALLEEKPIQPQPNGENNPGCGLCSSEQVAQFALKIALPPSFYAFLAETWAPQVGAGPVQNCIFLFGAAAACALGFTGPGFDVCQGLCSHSVMLCCVWEMKKSEFIKDCSILARGEAQHHHCWGSCRCAGFSGCSVKAAFFAELPGEGFLLEICFYLAKAK